MLEKQIFDLKKRNSEHKVEIDSLSKNICEMKILVADCCKKCEFISRQEEFKNNQSQLNSEFSDDLKSILSQINRVNSILNDHGMENTKIQESITDISKNQWSLSLLLKEFRTMFDFIEIPCELEKIKNEQKNQKTELSGHLNRIDKTMCVPFSEVILSHEKISKQSSEAISISLQSKEIAERIGVEIKILNRKMNEILEKIKS